jgi:dolichol-phosphate mannosyltransferase
MDNLCIIIPAKNEEATISNTVAEFYNALNSVIDFSILIVNDYSDDNTSNVLNTLQKKYPIVKSIDNMYSSGVGNAIRYGIENSKGTVIAICMADGSDSPKDVLESYKLIINEGYECVFGSRFIKGGHVIDYPYVKLLLNRIFNNGVELITRNQYNDYSNIFKMYRRTVIDKIMPISSEGFSIGLEMSLKAFNINAKIKVIPITWKQRKAGKSKLNLIKNIKVYMTTLYENRRK